MISENLDSRYLDWLYSQIGPNNRNPARSYSLLAEQLHNTEFTWSVPNDDNRLEDGVDLREEFLEFIQAERDRRWLRQNASMLEVLIALSRRAEFESTHEAYDWFWRMVSNIGLRDYTDDVYDERVHDHVEDVIADVIERRYDSNGHGGLFPLHDPETDQRRVELWFQMSSYLLENGYE